MWWNDQKIHATVNREYVASKLKPQDRQLLEQPLAFGDGLTDDTYIDWILQRSRRLFLILLDIGVPEQIFGVIDDSWDDEDLPISSDAVQGLNISMGKDEELRKRFYSRQFWYLMQEINQGDHLTFAKDEVVPLELCVKRAGVAFVHTSEKVYFPRRPEEVFMRKRVPLAQLSSKAPNIQFKAVVDEMKSAVHEHIISIYASYTYEDCGYVLYTPASELTLRTFINLTPQHFRNYPKEKQQIILLNWLHCLADAVAFLHSRGLSHRNIRPSSILIDSSDKILLGDTGAFEKLLGDKRPNPLECYNYGAPENWMRASTLEEISEPENLASAPGDGPPQTPGSGLRLWRTVSSPSAARMKRASTIDLLRKSISSNHSDRLDEKTDSQQSDVYSLACINLDILSFVMKRKLTTFASHRSSKNKSSGNSLPDSSFHANPEQLKSWIQMLESRALKKEALAMQGVPLMLRLCERMLAREPSQRPSAKYAEEILYDILMGPARLGVLHCGMYGDGRGSFDDPFGETASFVTKQSSNSSSSLTTIKAKAKGWHLPTTAGKLMAGTLYGRSAH